MSILIKGMEMPTSCGGCPFQDRHNEMCRLHDDDYGSWCEEFKHCPLVPIPPHGRLIDADALCDGLVSNHPVVIYASNAPTIIPAEEKT